MKLLGNLFSGVSILAASALLAAPGHARILFVETFSTGTLPNAGAWTVTQSGTDFSIEEDAAGQGPGDGLLAIRGTADEGSPTWDDNLYSTLGFPRGENLRVSFRMWVKFGTNALTAIHGPFHNANSGPVYSNLEAALDYTYNNYRWAEATNINPLQQGKTLTGINSNYNGNTKNGSLLVKVTLGDTRGARLDWYRTDVNAVSSNPRGEGEIDTIGQALQPAGQEGASDLVTGQASTVWLGFGNFDANPGTIYIDDIVVENDEVANPGGKTILYVYAARDWRATSSEGGGNTPGGDFRLMHLLEQIGYNVIAMDDNEVQASDADAVDAVIVSSTVGAGNVGTTFLNTTKGVLTWESGIFGGMNIAAASANTGTVAGQSQVQVDSGYTTLTAGLNGAVTVSANTDDFRYVTLTPAATGAIKVATIAGQPDNAAIVAYEQGSQMENNFLAPGRRVGFFLGNFRAAETLTPQGRQLFKAAVDWIADNGTSSPTPSGSAHWSVYE